MRVCCECCVLSGRDLCDELITRPEESYLLRCVVVCDLETSRMRRPWPALGRSATKKEFIFKSIKKLPEVNTLTWGYIYIYIYIYIFYYQLMKLKYKTVRMYH